MKTLIIATLIAFSHIPFPTYATQTDEALDLAARWQSSDVRPIMGDDGRILFAYGLSQPVIVCSPLKLCDIALQPGELVNSLKLADKARWVIDGAVVGTDENRVEHIIIKPKQANLENSLFIATNYRSYSINLISHVSENMLKVGFTYGDTLINSTENTDNSSVLDVLTEGRRSPNEDRQNATVISDRDILGINLNFDYRIEGHSVKWKPVRVYDDGIKTFIDFDVKNILGRELPTLVVYDTDTLGAMINYRAQKGRYIVDGLFDNAGLVLGVGKKQSKVTIKRIARNTAVDQPYGN